MSVMSVKETRARLSGVDSHPVDESVAALTAALAGRHPHVMVPDLARCTDLLDLLGSPQKAFPSVHISGTNGKTSTARMIDELLRAFGLRTGRFTSPHLQRVMERISIAGVPISSERLAQVLVEITPYVELVDVRHAERVTFFELLTALAFAAFADAPVDVGVIEVGLGGSWDATNIIAAPVVVITTVDLDHTEMLGESVAEIATEKAGIIVPEATAVLAYQPPEAADVLLRRIAQVKATPVREGVEFSLAERRLAVGGQQLAIRGLGGSYEEIFLPLYGAHQAHNAVCALAAVEAFLGGGRQRLDIDAVRSAFAAVTSPGRLEVLRRSPTVLLDAAHNPAGARALAVALEEEFAFRSLIGVVAILADKDVAQMLAPLEPVLDAIVVTTNSSERAMPVDALAALAVDVFGSERVDVQAHLDAAIAAAVDWADEGGDVGGAGVVITGSVVTVGDARSLLRPA